MPAPPSEWYLSLELGDLSVHRSLAFHEFGPHRLQALDAPLSVQLIPVFHGPDVLHSGANGLCLVLELLNCHVLRAEGHAPVHHLFGQRPAEGPVHALQDLAGLPVLPPGGRGLHALHAHGQADPVPGALQWGLEDAPWCRLGYARQRRHRRLTYPVPADVLPEAEFLGFLRAER